GRQAGCLRPAYPRGRGWLKRAFWRIVKTARSMVEQVAEGGTIPRSEDRPRNEFLYLPVCSRTLRHAHRTPSPTRCCLERDSLPPANGPRRLRFLLDGRR